MGLFSNLKAVKAEVDSVKAASGSLGIVEVPGEAKLELPAGQVRITYQQVPPRWLSGDTRTKKSYGTAPQIAVTIEGLEVEPVSAHAATGNTGDVQKASLATVEVGKPGAYSVRTEPQAEFYSRDGLEPKVLFDPDE